MQQQTPSPDVRFAHEEAKVLTPRQKLVAEVFFDPRMGCFHALTATGFFSGPGSPATGSFSGPANPLEFCF